MDSKTRQDLLKILCPLMRSEEERRALLNHALENNTLIHRLELAGANEPCISNIIDQLINFGEIDLGRPALWALLEVARDKVGLEDQKYIDAMEAIILKPPPSERVASSLTQSANPARNYPQR